MAQRFDDAVVGAGILGLAHAYHLAKQGRHVVVFERSPRAMGASIRNFGMLWPIGQPTGPLRRLALRSLAIWLEILAASGLWYSQAGSLHLAYHEDEARILEEFARSADGELSVEILAPGAVLSHSPAINPEGLIVGLWSPMETCIDPREVMARLPGWLATEYGVQFQFGCAVSACDLPFILAGGQQWEAQRLFVCTGDDLQSLFPNLYRGADLTPCKLQMMRSEPTESGWRLGPMLAAGLTLRHYASFRDCPSLPALKDRIAREMPEYERFGIHVMAAQNGYRELVIGDSHEYGQEIEPFDREGIDELILRYLRSFLVLPGVRIASRWHGVYVKHSSAPFFQARPAPGVMVVTGIGGAGMTLSFGVAEQVVREVLEEV